MRDIEFRYWNSSEKKMYFQQSRGWTEFPNTLEKDDVYLQSTGLKDKNGVLIYEGDIARCFDKESTVEKIEWVDYRWSVFEHCPTELLEIIGNIYENPELLK